MSEKDSHEIENFYGCYLLCSQNEKYKGRTYIGFTVDPNRRIKQHNSGYSKGGAKRTSGKGPWEMVLIIHGFPNEISALRFEWAWQNPEQSLRLKHLVPKTKHYNFIFKFNVVAEMLRIGPWCRLPLTIRWLKQEYEQEFNINKMPPAHMPIVYGPVKIVKKPSKQQQQKKTIEVQSTQSASQSKNCFLCKTLTNDSNRIKCIKCHVDTHMTCLSKVFLNKETDQIMPIEGDCPRCRQCFLWGDLMRFRLGCYTDLDMSVINYDTDDNENDDGDIDEIDSD